MQYSGLVEVIEGFHIFGPTSLPRHVADTPPSKNDLSRVWMIEEKQTDVNLAFHAPSGSRTVNACLLRTASGCTGDAISASSLTTSSFPFPASACRKTQASKALLSELGDFLRIDPDEFRNTVPGYDGTNSWLIRSAVSYLVQAVLDRAFKQKQSFLLDGTLSSYTVAERNIQRCIDKGRDVQIIYVYQDPKLAWDFDPAESGGPPPLRGPARGRSECRCSSSPLTRGSDPAGDFPLRPAMFEIFRSLPLSAPLVEKTSLSRFVRDASSEEKKGVYKRVIQKATAEQNEVLAAASRRRQSRLRNADTAAG
jgi:hypothetical protein